MLKYKALENWLFIKCNCLTSAGEVSWWILASPAASHLHGKLHVRWKEALVLSDNSETDSVERWSVFISHSQTQAAHENPENSVFIISPNNRWDTVNKTRTMFCLCLKEPITVWDPDTQPITRCWKATGSVQSDSQQVAAQGLGWTSDVYCKVCFFNIPEEKYQQKHWELQRNSSKQQTHTEKCFQWTLCRNCSFISFDCSSFSGAEHER